MPTAKDIHEMTTDYLSKLTDKRLRIVEKIAQTEQAPTQGDLDELTNLQTTIDAFTAAIAQQSYELTIPSARNSK